MPNNDCFPVLYMAWVDAFVEGCLDDYSWECVYVGDDEVAAVKALREFNPNLTWEKLDFHLDTWVHGVRLKSECITESITNETV